MSRKDDLIRTAKEVTLTLDNFQFAAAIDWDVQTDIRYLADILSANFRLPSESMTKIKISYPSTWWQHVKQDLFPNWLKSRYPVVYKDEIIDSRVAYTKISMPNQPHFKYLRKVFRDEI